MGRWLAGFVMLVVTVAFFAGYTDQAGIQFIFIFAILLILAEISYALDQLRKRKDSPIMEYQIKTMGFSGDFDEFSVWLEQLNNERWELVTILAEPIHDGLFYGVFARPSKLPIDR